MLKMTNTKNAICIVRSSVSGAASFNAAVPIVMPTMMVTTDILIVCPMVRMVDKMALAMPYS